MQEETNHQVRTYTPFGTAIDFHDDNESQFKLAFGHVGSGKSTFCCIDVFLQFMDLPLCKDGVRRGKWAIVRNTYPELKMTTVATWLMWFPEEQFGRLYKSSPYKHEMRFRDDAGVWCELDVYFMSLDSPADAKKLLSFELTGFYFNEIREIAYIIVEQAMTRLTCRYPSKEMLGLPEDYQGMPYKQSVIADTNPPHARHWIRRKFEIEKQRGCRIFKQPPAMIFDVETNQWIINPDRENKAGVPSEAIVQMSKTLDPETFKVYVLGEYASVFEGKPVHPSYKTHIHYSSEIIEPVPGEPIYLGWDFGLTPCVVIGQYIQGQLRLLDNLYTFNEDLDQFLTNTAVPFLFAKYGEWLNEGNYVSTGDPSGNTPGQATGAYCLDTLNKHRIGTMPAYTNSPVVRQAAINKHLNRMVNGEPGLIVSNQCTFLNDAFSGGYRYKIINTFEAGKQKYADVPDKNEYSHTAEAAQYLAMPLSNDGATDELETETYWDGQSIKTRYKEKVR